MHERRQGTEGRVWVISRVAYGTSALVRLSSQTPSKFVSLAHRPTHSGVNQGARPGSVDDPAQSRRRGHTTARARRPPSRPSPSSFVPKATSAGRPGRSRRRARAAVPVCDSSEGARERGRERRKGEREGAREGAREEVKVRGLLGKCLERKVLFRGRKIFSWPGRRDGLCRLARPPRVRPHLPRRAPGAYCVCRRARACCLSISLPRPMHNLSHKNRRACARLGTYHICNVFVLCCMHICTHARARAFVRWRWW